MGPMSQADDVGIGVQTVCLNLPSGSTACKDALVL